MFIINLFSIKNGIRPKLLKSIICLTIISIIFSSEKVEAQQFPYTQFHASKILYSPSHAGKYEALRLYLHQRKTDKIGGIRSNIFGADWFMTNIKSGMGINIFRDEVAYGNLYYTNIAINYNYRIQLSKKWFFKPGMNYNLSYNTINYNNLIFSDQYEDYFIGGEIAEASKYEINRRENKAIGDFKVSALIHDDKHEIGIVLDHLKSSKSTKEGKIQNPLTIYFMGDFNFKLTKNEVEKNLNRVETSILIKSQLNSAYADVGLYWNPDFLTSGIMFRGIPFAGKNENKEKKPEALSFILAVRLFNFDVGYSYDISLTKNINFQEISVSFLFQNLFTDENEP